ncbi:hypothetical protein WEU38_07635 [Cyanobacterium aponinum AL20118]|uniref:Uncharacterized protein n=1 Tax=Cyanobacterium aponinum AL20115 TaxID=3090662 RepID=A0AAF0ZE92_9CHRO|nr:hypothetical protein [Cyanobacterium aponinum]WPF90135.1 hypothetical protein SAY89_07655 [Cyanobacterium aponinum AL20115]
MENNQLKYHQLKNKLIGEILQEAGFVNSDQVAVALMEQSFYTHLKLGEILALHGWVNQELVDFFAERIQLPPKKEAKKIGEYLLEAGLLTEKDIQQILKEQHKSGVKFGSLAVLRGCIKQETLNFFLKYFTNEGLNDNHLQYKIRTLSKQSKFTNSHKNTTHNDMEKEKSFVTSSNNHRDKQSLNSKHTKNIIDNQELVEDDLESMTWLKTSY